MNNLVYIIVEFHIPTRSYHVMPYGFSKRSQAEDSVKQMEKNNENSGWVLDYEYSVHVVQIREE